PPLAFPLAPIPTSYLLIQVEGRTAVLIPFREEIGGNLRVVAAADVAAEERLVDGPTAVEAHLRQYLLKPAAKPHRRRHHHLRRHCKPSSSPSPPPPSPLQAVIITVTTTSVAIASRHHHRHHHLRRHCKPSSSPSPPKPS
ncbi:hypothetical protein Vretifemale_18146, partial [Volvox reticuliferus]